MENPLANPFILHIIIRSLLLPAGITLLTGVLSMALVQHISNRRLQGLIWSAVLLCGFLGGYFSVYRDWSPWPQTVLAWVPILVFSTFSFTVWFGWSRKPAKHSSIALIIIMISSSILLLPFLKQISLEQAVLKWLETSVLWWVIWSTWAITGSDQRASGMSQFIVAIGLAIASPLSGSILLGQLAGTIAASWLIILLLAWIQRSILITSPCADMGALLLGVVFIELWIYAGASPIVVGWLAISAMVGAIFSRAYYALGSLSNPTILIIFNLINIIPIGIGLYFAWQNYLNYGGGY